MCQANCNNKVKEINNVKLTTKELKICSSCHIRKELKEFSFEKDGNYYRGQCKRCRLDKIKVPPIVFEVNGVLSRNCGQCHTIKPLSEFGLQKGRQSSSNCKTCHSLKRKRRHIIHRDRENQQSKAYSLKNKDKMRVWKRQYERDKRHNSIEYKIQCQLIGAINRTVTKGYKSDRTLNLLGCTLEFFFTHIESQFKPGMTWENHGHGEHKWNLDHIVPCEIFNLLDAKHQQLCFNYKNIQPLWYVDNVTKSDFLPDRRRARDLTPEQKLDYLKSLGYDV